MGFDCNVLSRLLERIEGEEGSGKSVTGWLSTHPSSTKRVRNGAADSASQPD